MMLFRRGYSFAEVLFAVIILAIGFIMIVAIFPAAILQSKLTAEETSGADIARGAVAVTQIDRTATFPLPLPANLRILLPTDLFIQCGNGANQLPPKLATGENGGFAVAATSNVPANTTITIGQVISMQDQRVFQSTTPPNNYPLRDAMWNFIRGKLINDTDPRYAYAVMYRRNRTFTNSTAAALSAAAPGPGMLRTDASIAQLIVLCLEVRNRPIYEPSILTPAGGVSEIMPKPVNVDIQNNYNNTGVDVVTFTDISMAAVTQAIAENTYIVISDDGLAAPVSGRFNGRIYRVGAHRPEVGNDSWELLPGSDFDPDPGADGVLGNADDIIRLPMPAPIGIAGAGTTALVVGRGYSDPLITPTGVPGAPSTYLGPTQDVSIYTTLISIPQ